jgi:hypothetical protein
MRFRKRPAARAGGRRVSVLAWLLRSAVTLVPGVMSGGLRKGVALSAPALGPWSHRGARRHRLRRVTGAALEGAGVAVVSGERLGRPLG